MSVQIKIKYADLLPPLSTDEFEALKSSIKRDGVMQPIVIDEEGAILDGHHRYRIDKNAPRRIVKGLSEAEKLAFVYRSNLTRRNLSPAQKKEIARAMRKVAQDLNHGKMKQSEIAAVLGVAQKTVSAWLDSTNNIPKYKTCKPKYDSRVTVPKQAHADIYERAQQGERQVQIAADFGVSQQQISNIVSAESKRINQRNNGHSGNGQAAGDNWKIYCGDFRDIMGMLEPNSVDLIFTDPPYDEESIPLYFDMAQHAARVLKPGASLICYAGHYAIGKIISGMEQHLRYWWIISLQHSGNSARLHGKWVFVGWKPLLWFVKERRRDNEYISDTFKSEQPDKDYHEWQQDASEAEYYIQHLTQEGDTVLDPFAGSGTTVIAAQHLGRIGLGIERDEDRASTAIRRIQTEP